MIPAGALNDSATRVLLAVVDGCRTYADLMERTGIKRNTLWHRLQELRDEGLVTWVDGTQGTLRPLVSEVPEPLFVSGYTGPETSGPGERSQRPPDRAQHRSRRR